MNEKNNSNLEQIQIADFMIQGGYYGDLRALKLSREQIPEQKTNIKWKKLKEKVIKFVAAVAVTSGVVTATIKYWNMRDEAMKRREPQEVIHIDTTTPTPKPTSFEDAYLEQQQKELEEAQKNIIKNYYEGDDLMQKTATTQEVYSAPELTKITMDSNIAAYDRTTAGINISTEVYDNIVNPGSNYSECERCLTTDLKEKFEAASNTYGADPNLLIAIAMQETNLGRDLTNSYAIGIMQIEKELLNEIVKAYNYKTKEFESKKITTDNIDGTTKNINMGAAIFQSRSMSYDNYLFALQSYNYGPGAMEVVLKLAEKRTGKPREELTFDEVYPSIEYVHYHPQQTLNPNWKFDTFGDKDYAKNVVSYLKNNITYNKVTLDGETIYLHIYNASTGNKIKSYIQEGDLYVDPTTNQRYTKEEITSAIELLSNLIEENKNKKTK